MRKMIIMTLIILSFMGFFSCQDNLVDYSSGDVKVSIEQGDEWLHDFPLFLGLKKKNPPQIAIWIEDTSGHYVSTVYATYKIATQSWQMNNGNRRKEALPYWCYSRGVKYSDGLYLPTKDHPLVDGMTGATPHGSFNVKLKPTDKLKKFVVKIEINHSTDFNDYYPKSAKEGDANYSGGKDGSGQPAVVYSADVDLSSGKKTFEAKLIGHSSPDGTSGNLYTDMSGLTTALHIVKNITISIQ
ncbi:MAG: hypothetical protein KA955_04700 [Prevotella sp.]|nr:hypothetical protein [Prevotella sp.]